MDSIQPNQYTVPAMNEGQKTQHPQDGHAEDLEGKQVVLHTGTHLVTVTIFFTGLTSWMSD